MTPERLQAIIGEITPSSKLVGCSAEEFIAGATGRGFNHLLDPEITDDNEEAAEFFRGKLRSRKHVKPEEVTVFKRSAAPRPVETPTAPEPSMAPRRVEAIEEPEPKVPQPEPQRGSFASNTKFMGAVVVVACLVIVVLIWSSKRAKGEAQSSIQQLTVDVDRAQAEADSSKVALQQTAEELTTAQNSLASANDKLKRLQATAPRPGSAGATPPETVAVIFEGSNKLIPKELYLGDVPKGSAVQVVTVMTPEGNMLFVPTRLVGGQITNNISWDRLMHDAIQQGPHSDLAQGIQRSLRQYGVDIGVTDYNLAMTQGLVRGQ